MRRGSLVSRLIALALLLCVLFGIGWLAWLPLLSVQEARNAAVELGQRVAVMQQTAGLKVDPKISAEIAEQLKFFQFTAGARGVQIASLQEQVRGYAAKENVTITQIAELPSAPTGDTSNTIALRLQVVGQPRSLIGLFRQLESATPWLKLDNLDMRRTQTNSVEAQAEPPLEAEFEIVAIVGNSQDEQ